MKLYLLLLTLLQFLGCSGAPLYNSELEAVANRGLQAALSEVNSMYAASHLYGVTRGSISRVIPVGMNMVDLLMTFGIKETQCLKTSRNDPQTCAFRPGFFVPSFSCFSRVRMTSTSAQVVSLRCGHDGSSSSESSEEVFSRRRHQINVPFANRENNPPPPPPVHPDRLFQNPTEDVQPRGDTFSNFVE
ncbi:secreted phosphoprotein 24 [Sphaeramia orbicularis]|uniref:secreted phosphoprotein 24 n=1 Tax=Sphaeramia orbicularis TaxID=375764 RepID=UPI0011813198|nr:secreted phosphoprotein 24 [Sphaeramia orbicularis]